MTPSAKSNTSDLHHIFRSIVQAIGQVVNLPVSIWIPDEKNQILRIRASLGLPATYVRKATLSLSEPSVTGEAFSTGKVVEIHNISSDPRWKYKKEAQQMGWNSTLCVPIRAHKSVIGVISIYSFVARSFSEMEKRLLLDYAAQLELRLEAEKMKKTLNQLFDLGQKIEQKIVKQPKVVLQEIVTKFGEITGADCVVLYPYDAQRENFYDINSVAAYGLRKKLEPSDKPRSEGGMATYVKREGRVILSDIEKENPVMLESPFIKREGIKAFMGLALSISNTVLGILYLDFRTPHQFSEDEQKVIQLFAHQAAIAINNTNLYQQLDSRAKALSKLHKVAPRLVSITPNPKNLKSVLKQIAEDAQLVLGADLVDLYQYNQSEDDFVLPPVQLGERNEPSVIKDQIHDDDVVREVIRSGVQYVANAQEDKSLAQPFRTSRSKSTKKRFVVREKLQSVASIPLSVGSEVVGVLFANYRSPQTFSQQQQELIELFADQAAIAIYNSRLYQQAKQQAKTLEKLQSIGLDLVSLSGSPKSLRSTLKYIAQSAQDVLKADLVDLYQYFEDSAEFDLPPIQSGKRYEPKVRKEKIQQDDVILSIVKSRQTHYILDSQANDRLVTPFSEDRTGLPALRFAEREKIKSTAAIPLLISGEVVGALFANYRAPQSFSSEQKNLIELFASQAAIAIHNSRLYWESLQRAKRLELVRNVAAAVSSTTDIQQILKLAVHGLARVFGVKQAAVALFNEAGEFAKIQVEYLEPGCISALGAAIPLQDNPQIDKIRETKKPLVVDDVEHDPIMAPIRDIMAMRKTVSLMVIPIIIDDTVVGTIGIDAIGQKRHFTEEDAELAQAIANQASTALRIAKQLDERLSDIHALQEITEQMHQGDLGAVLDLIAERAVELTGAKHGGVWLVNKTRTALEFGGLAHKGQYEQLPPNIPLNKKGENSFSKKVVLNGQAYLSSDVRKDKNYKTWYPDTRSELTVPVIYREKVIGTINVESPRENSFTEDHKRLLEAMAGQAAVIVQNARLLERINVLDDIGVELTSGTRPEESEILESICDQAQRLTGAQDMYIALYDEESGQVRFPIATEKGERVSYPTRPANMVKRGKTEEIILTHQPILHKTLKEAEEWYSQPEHEEKANRPTYPSWLGVPMMVGKKVLGVIAIYDLDQEQAYDEQDLQVFSIMAGEAAFALVNRELNRRMLALATLNDIGKTLTSGIRLRQEEILDLIFTQTQTLTGATDLYIALYDETTGEIRFPLATEKGRKISYPSRKADMEKRGKTEEIIFTRKPLLHKTKKEGEEWYSQLSHAEFTGRIPPSWLGVPMMVGERILGVIAALDYDQEYVYDELHLEVLLPMANQAAIALDNASLYYDINQKLGQTNQQLEQANEKLEQTNEQLDTVLQIINAVEVHVDLHEFLQHALEDLLERIHAQHGTIQLYDPRRDELMVWAKVGDVLNPSYQHIPLGTGLTGNVAQNKCSLYIPDTQSSADYVGYISDTRSEFAAPMMINDTLIGVLNIEDPAINAFGAYERQLVELLGNQLAILVRQKWIAQQLEDKRLVYQVNESLGLVTAEVAHKVGNAAGKIRYLARERLLPSPNVSENEKKDIQVIIRNVEDMINATEDLFKPFGAEPKAEISIQQMIRVAIGQCAVPQNIEVCTNLASDLPKVCVQVTKVQSYLSEILNNAIKYTVRGMESRNAECESVVIIGQRGSDGFVEILFTNHGPAIPPENWEGIFRVFSARGVKSQDDQSYGLGLWGARATMEQQGGNVSLLESDHLKTTFVVRLPPA